MAIVLSDVRNGFVEIIPEGESYGGDMEDFIGNKLGYNIDDLQWIMVDDIRIHVDGEARDLHISDVIYALKLRGKMDTLKDEFIARLIEYKQAYIPEKTESLNILEYGENEFFGGKKEVYEDILEYMQKNGL